MNTLRLLFQQETESRLLLTISRFLASIFLLLLLALPTLAQEVEPTVELGEVEVKADRIIHKTDGLLLYPSEQQKASSRSGYSLLQQLTLPNIRVDEVSHSISAIDQRGGVQIRINGIIADKAEMLSLDPKSIRKIDFIDNPGVRYGDGIAYVIRHHYPTGGQRIYFRNLAHPGTDYPRRRLHGVRQMGTQERVSCR